ncbi:MAG: uncharacterized protein A8A55_1716 [Amphiamblys sp. WSBS2006]|nr:MAG: uncharacterized protein A8A55_1716 [Amphiamblys sp. WSBS2006]
MDTRSGKRRPSGDYSASHGRNNEKKTDEKPQEQEEQEATSWADDVKEAIWLVEKQEAARMEAEKLRAERQAGEEQKAAILAGEELLDTEMGEEKEAESETRGLSKTKRRSCTWRRESQRQEGTLGEIETGR